MFSKHSREPEAAETTPGRKIAVASLVAEGVLIRGDLTTAGDLHLDGAVEGDVRVGLLTLGETGSVDGAIHADVVEIHGRIAGTICARRVKLWATAHVDGDISHTELAIEPGARFEGRSLALVPPPAEEQPSLSVVAAE